MTSHGGPLDNHATFVADISLRSGHFPSLLPKGTRHSSGSRAPRSPAGGSFPQNPEIRIGFVERVAIIPVDAPTHVQDAFSQLQWQKHAYPTLHNLPGRILTFFPMPMLRNFVLESSIRSILVLVLQSPLRSHLCPTFLKAEFPHL